MQANPNRRRFQMMTEQEKIENKQAEKDLANYAIQDLRRAGIKEGVFYTHDEIYSILYAYFRNENPESTNQELDSEVIDVLNMMNYSEEETLLESGYRIIPTKKVI